MNFTSIGSVIKLKRLAPKSIGPYHIFKKKNLSPMVYKLNLHTHIAYLSDVFYVSWGNTYWILELGEVYIKDNIFFKQN